MLKFFFLKMDSRLLNTVEAAELSSRLYDVLDSQENECSVEDDYEDDEDDQIDDDDAHRDRVRSVMTETMFGQLKGQWPYITNMRSYLQLWQKIIIATTILFNIKEWEGQATSEPYEVPTFRPRVQLSAREILQDGKRQREILTQGMQPIYI